jgi:hypothetical protein
MSAACPTTLLGMLRDYSFYPVLVALLSESIRSFEFPGALPYWMYRQNRDEVIASQEQIDAVLKVVATGIGRRTLKATGRTENGVTTLRISASAKTALLMEMLALGANLSAHDLATLPPPLDLQQRPRGATTSTARFPQPSDATAY